MAVGPSCLAALPLSAHILSHRQVAPVISHLQLHLILESMAGRHQIVELAGGGECREATVNSPRGAHGAGKGAGHGYCCDETLWACIDAKEWLGELLMSV